jgi:hypothetical protein
MLVDKMPTKAIQMSEKLSSLPTAEDGVRGLATSPIFLEKGPRVMATSGTTTAKCADVRHWVDLEVGQIVDKWPNGV